MQSQFDLALSFPQWQGSGRHENLPRGAAAAARVCGRFAPLDDVPLSQKEGDSAGVRRWEPLFEQFQSARTILNRSRAKRVLTAGGDCSVDVAVIDYLNRIHPNLTVIWIDAHIDGNTPEVSPSGCFHGMPVAALLGRPPAPMRALLGKPIDPQRFHYYGMHVGDDGDWSLHREFGLGNLDPETLPKGPVHIHFDLDVLDPAEFPYLAYTDGKLAIDDAIVLVGDIAQNADLVGLTITEFSPATEDDARAGSEVIAWICEAALGQQGSLA